MCEVPMLILQVFFNFFITIYFTNPNLNNDDFIFSL